MDSEAKDRSINQVNLEAARMRLNEIRNSLTSTPEEWSEVKGLEERIKEYSALHDQKFSADTQTTA